MLAPFFLNKVKPAILKGIHSGEIEITRISQPLKRASVISFNASTIWLSSVQKQD